MQVRKAEEKNGCENGFGISEKMLYWCACTALPQDTGPDYVKVWEADADLRNGKSSPAVLIVRTHTTAGYKTPNQSRYAPLLPSPIGNVHTIYHSEKELLQMYGIKKLGIIHKR